MACDASGHSSTCPRGNRFRARASDRSCSSVIVFGIALRNTKSVDPAEISAASGSESSTSAPPEIQLKTRRRNTYGTPGANMTMDMSIAFGGIGANVMTASSSVSSSGPPGGTVDRRPAADRHTQQMHLLQPEPGQRLVQPPRLVVGTGNRLVLHGQPGLPNQVDAVVPDVFHNPVRFLDRFGLLDLGKQGDARL